MYKSLSLLQWHTVDIGIIHGEIQMTYATEVAASSSLSFVLTESSVCFNSNLININRSSGWAFSNFWMDFSRLANSFNTSGVNFSVSKEIPGKNLTIQTNNDWSC